MAKYDLEDFRSYFLNLIKDNMSAKLAEITAEKADSITLDAPDADHYIHSIDDQALAFDPFVHYGFSEIESASQGGSILWKPTMFFAYYFLDDSQKGDVAETKILRYTRAMVEIIAANAAQNSYISTPEIIPLPPAIVSFAMQDGSDYKVGGIEIKGSFMA